MESRSLEIKVMFGKDLKAFNFFQKLTIYVLVSIVSDDPGKKLKQNQEQRTPTDTEGDGNPEWNHEMRFDLKEIQFQDCDHIFVHFEFKHGLMFGDKTIGEVRVPIKDLISEFNGVVRFVNYEVRNTDGKPNGVLTFSYKVNGINMNSAVGTQITGFPIAHNSHQPQPASEIQYPAYSSPLPPGSLYPPLEIQTATMEPTQQEVQVQYLSPGRRPQAPQESYYPPPPDAYYPPPAPPFYPYEQPLQSPTAHGAYYPPAGVNSAEPEMPGHSGGHVYSFGPGETSPNGYLYGNYHHSSSWDGR